MVFAVLMIGSRTPQKIEMTEEALRLGGYGTLTVIYTDEDLDELLEDPDD